MPFLPIIDVIKLVPEFQLPNGQVAVNTLYVGGQQEISTGLLSSAIDAYVEWFGEFGDAQMSADVQLVRVTATDMTVEDGRQVIENFTPGLAGAVSSPMQPAQVTFCTSFRTGYSGRNKRGRAYWIGLAESQVTGSFVNTSNANSIRSAWEGFGLIMANNSIPHVVVSRSLLTPGGTASYNDVTTYVNTTNRVATQRRRLPGAGS